MLLSGYEWQTLEQKTCIFLGLPQKQKRKRGEKKQPPRILHWFSPIPYSFSIWRTKGEKRNNHYHCRMCIFYHFLGYDLGAIFPKHYSIALLITTMKVVDPFWAELFFCLWFHIVSDGYQIPALFGNDSNNFCVSLFVVFLSSSSIQDKFGRGDKNKENIFLLPLKFRKFLLPFVFLASVHMLQVHQKLTLARLWNHPTHEDHYKKHICPNPSNFYFPI